ncbi:MAG TPA: DUF1116 domain-containing protein [Symbiobacteriaceae bacterium]|nr:DUF1116 domain-containing protein [Symbiobacteriaceae bacterium]
MLKLLGSEVKVINLGIPSFAEDLAHAGAEALHVDWRPPAGGSVELLAHLTTLQLLDEKIASANQEAMTRLAAFQPALIGIDLARNAIPGFDSHTILHAGPPVTWERMCGPQRGAVIGALLFEGLAATHEEAETLAGSGQIKFAPAHHFGAVGPMAGVISPSMPVFIVENKAFGNRAYSTMNEGLGKVLRFGAFTGEVLDRLAWFRDELAPLLAKAFALSGPIDLKSITAKALQMGDECHNRNLAATSLFIRELMPHLIEAAGENKALLKRVAGFFAGNDHYFLNLSMATCKSALDAAHGIPYSTLVTAMSRNGTDFGIRVSGLGDQWFTAPAGLVEGLYFPGYTEADANPDMGDSAITETFGIGGFAMAAAPAIVKFVGGNAPDAVRYTKEMGLITLGTNSAYTLPTMNFSPAPMGIDLRAVIARNLQPLINTGIAHRLPGVGQIGAGLVRAPLTCFEAALAAAAADYSK